MYAKCPAFFQKMCGRGTCPSVHAAVRDFIGTYARLGRMGCLVGRMR